MLKVNGLYSDEIMYSYLFLLTYKLLNNCPIITQKIINPIGVAETIKASNLKKIKQIISNNMEDRRVNIKLVKKTDL